jgi:hypothetical protein
MQGGALQSPMIIFIVGSLEQRRLRRQDIEVPFAVMVQTARVPIREGAVRSEERRSHRVREHRARMNGRPRRGDVQLRSFQPMSDQWEAVSFAADRIGIQGQRTRANSKSVAAGKASVTYA